MSVGNVYTRTTKSFPVGDDGELGQIEYCEVNGRLHEDPGEPAVTISRDGEEVFLYMEQGELHGGITKDGHMRAAISHYKEGPEGGPSEVVAFHFYIRGKWVLTDGEGGRPWWADVFESIGGRGLVFYEGPWTGSAAENE